MKPMFAVYTTANVVVTVAAGLILDTILAVTNSYSTVLVLLWIVLGSLTRKSA